MSQSQHWTGFFEQDGVRHEKCIIVSRSGNDFTGFGSDEIGRFTIKGKYNGKNVSFLKSYGGLINVDYNGESQNDIIKGNWTLGDSKGTFELNTAPKQHWYGYFEQNGTRNDMMLLLNLDKSKLSGKGMDKIGNFTINGEVILDRCRFKKTYEGLISVDYSGIVTGNNIIGVWVLEGKDKGMFELGFQLDTSKQTSWSGYFEQFGKKNNMDLNIYLDGTVLTGCGHDYIGCFFINGFLFNGEISFVKRYGGLVEVEYRGKDANGKASGEWTLGQSRGNFQLTH